jgi:hypothetical protein
MPIARDRVAQVDPQARSQYLLQMTGQPASMVGAA